MRSPQTLSEADRRIVAGRAADCAERVLGCFFVVVASATQMPSDVRLATTAKKLGRKALK